MQTRVKTSPTERAGPAMYYLSFIDLERWEFDEILPPRDDISLGGNIIPYISSPRDNISSDFPSGRSINDILYRKNILSLHWLYISRHLSFLRLHRASPGFCRVWGLQKLFSAFFVDFFMFSASLSSRIRFVSSSDSAIS